MAKCKESAGVLYPHPCTREATLTCGACEKPICALHSRDSSAGRPICIACFKKIPNANPERQRTDPFLMATAYYPDYDTGGSSLRLRSAMVSSDTGDDLDPFETDFDGT